MMHDKVTGLEFTRVFFPVDGASPRIEKRNIPTTDEGYFELYLRYCKMACAAQKADPARVQVFWDSVSIRVYQKDEKGRDCRFSELYPVRVFE